MLHQGGEHMRAIYQYCVLGICEPWDINAGGKQTGQRMADPMQSPTPDSPSTCEDNRCRRILIEPPQGTDIVNHF